MNDTTLGDSLVTAFRESWFTWAAKHPDGVTLALVMNALVTFCVEFTHNMSDRAGVPREELINSFVANTLAYISAKEDGTLARSN